MKGSFRRAILIVIGLALSELTVAQPTEAVRYESSILAHSAEKEVELLELMTVGMLSERATLQLDSIQAKTTHFCGHPKKELWIWVRWDFGVGLTT